MGGTSGITPWTLVALGVSSTLSGGLYGPHKVLGVPLGSLTLKGSGAYFGGICGLSGVCLWGSHSGHWDTGALRADLKGPRGRRHVGGAGTLAVGRGPPGPPRVQSWSSRCPQVRVPAGQRRVLRELRHCLSLYRQRHGPAAHPGPAHVYDPALPGALGRREAQREAGRATRGSRGPHSAP